MARALPHAGPICASSGCVDRLAVLWRNTILGPNSPSRRHSFQHALWFLLLAIVYFLCDQGLDRFAFKDGWTILWPLNGVSVALLVMNRRRNWPGILLAVGMGVGTGEILNHNPVVFEVLQRLISLLEVFICAWLLPKFETFEKWLRSRLIFYRFLAALILGPGISGILAAIQFHFMQGKPYGVSFNNWATADALGTAATLPLVLALRSPEMWALFRRGTWARTTGILMLSLLAAAVLLSVSSYPLLFLLFPILLLVEALLAFSGSAITAFGVSIIAVYMATHGRGPFGTWNPELAVSRDVALQIFLGFNLVALFPASIRTLERRRMSAEIIQTNAQLLTLASIDGLTGIANRRSLDEKFAMEWKRAMRTGSPLALLMVDIDHFKRFNDRHGHHAGDLCLKAVAAALKANLRRPHDVAARFGGEEFALLLPHTSIEDARDLAERIRVAITGLPIHHSGIATESITASIGCASQTPLPGEDHLHLLRSADAALYCAKQQGRNRVQISTHPSIPDNSEPADQNLVLATIPLES